MNYIEMEGYLTSNPIKVTRGDYQWVEFTLAVDYDKKRQYLECVAWDKQADLLLSLAVTKQALSFKGYVYVRQWKDRWGKFHKEQNLTVSQFTYIAGKRYDDSGAEVNIPSIATESSL